MRRIFADAQYWVALISEQDQSHAAAQAISGTLQGAMLYTTEEVLTEFLAFCAERGRSMRQLATATVRGIYANAMIQVFPQSHDSFFAGLALYEARPDKGYSLTDCVSMTVMRREGIGEVLTHDHHFRQEGFTILL
jgi:predicted nucleic acid-binding protein